MILFVVYRIFRVLGLLIVILVVTAHECFGTTGLVDLGMLV